jgi:hypothetical protein
MDKIALIKLESFMDPDNPVLYSWHLLPSRMGSRMDTRGMDESFFYFDILPRD